MALRLPVFFAFRRIITVNHKKKRKGVTNYAPRCPYCGSTTVYRSATGIYAEKPDNVMLYVCTNYPACDAYIRTQKGTAIPIGEMANGKLRALRTDAHRLFNQLYLKRYMPKRTAYIWLSSVLGVPYEKAHIAQLSEMQCELVIRETKKQLSFYETHKKPMKRRNENHDTDTRASANC